MSMENDFVTDSWQLENGIAHIDMLKMGRLVPMYLLTCPDIPISICVVAF